MFALIQSGQVAVYDALSSPDLGDPAIDDRLELQLYVGTTGTFDLATGGDENYSSCLRCTLLEEDPEIPGRLFFQSGGTLTIDAGSDAMNGTIHATFTDVTLIEVTIDANYVSTPVPGGTCLHLASASVDVISPPQGWRCDPSYYGDGTCDCGCGAFDSDDCADASVGSCARCDDIGSCSETGCPGTIDPVDNSTCPVPVGWTCDPSYYADGYCDCGCGVFDNGDCTDATVGSCEYCNDTGSCSASSCPGDIDPTDNSICAPSPPVPPNWTCDPNYYGDSDCDCGCGAFDDLDCADATVDACEYCDDAGSCSASACPGDIDPTDNSTCTANPNPVPPNWTCNPNYYGDSDCDCGCGAFDDLDCADATVDSCEYCNDAGSCSPGPCPGSIDPNDNSTCTANPNPVPPNWTCNASYYADGYCDCGCGAFDDLDCANATVGSCEYCDDTGSCSMSLCPGSIHPNDNWTCW